MNWYRNTIKNRIIPWKCHIYLTLVRHLRMIENGKYNPSLKLCVNIAKTLGTTLDTLFWENDT